MIHVGAQTVALRGFARMTVGERVVFDAASGGAFPVALDQSFVSGVAATQGGATVTTQPCTAMPSGGVAPYSYAWARTTGPAEFTAVSPTAQSTAFRCTSVNAGEDISATFEVTVTDARGRTSTATVDAVASNYGRLNGALEP